ncbi:MAG: FAD-dependent oxidoreductase [Candidatus Microthrix sp.]|nr:FAD-dependent oxidoreductase [Candidatus Microthrix sp.]
MSQEASFKRSEALQALRTRHFDLVVIGGGITGAGVALDAAARGLRTALIDGGDFASGTSSKSSKLVHGGLRYLQQGDVSLVYQALHERRRLLANAPHLVDIQPFLLPLFAKDGLIPKKLSRTLGAAMWAYDATGGWRIGKFHQRIDTAEAIAHMPTLPADKIGGAYIYYDAAADDARLVLTVIRTAVLDKGAVAANRVRALGLPRPPVASSTAWRWRPTASASRSPPQRSSTPAACLPTTCGPSTRRPTPARSPRPRAST